MRALFSPLFAPLLALSLIAVASVASCSRLSLEQWMQSQTLELGKEDKTLAKDIEFSKNYYDADGDCQDTRAEVLMKHSLESVTFKDTGKGDCVVEGGYWIDPYSGIHYDKVDDLFLDRRVSVAEAARSGGVDWSKERWKAFYNDADNLVPIWKYLDRSKGPRGAGRWEPAFAKADFARKWIHVKRKWGLSVDRKEAHEVRDLLTR